MMRASARNNEREDDHVQVDSPEDVIRALVTERHSCRAFLPDRVPRNTVRRILEIAQRTATWCNTQAWQVVITEPEVTNQLREELFNRAVSNVPAESDLPWPREYRGVYLQRRRETGFSLYNAIGIARDDMEGRNRQLLENFRLFGAPHLAVITSDEALGTYGAVDCGSYVANFLLAAQACGVATIAQAAVAQHSKFLREFLAVPDDRVVVCGISFGFEDTSKTVNKFRVGRASIDEAVRWVES